MPAPATSSFVLGASTRQPVWPGCPGRLLRQRTHLIPSASTGASSIQRVVLSTDRQGQQALRLAAGTAGAGAGTAGPSGGDGRSRRDASPSSTSPVVTAAASASAMPSTQPQSGPAVRTVPKLSLPEPSLLPGEFVPIPEDVIADFEHKLEADLQTVGVTITAILGVIIFWRGVWALLDHFIGDSVVGDICCIIVGLVIVLYIRLSGMKIASFWPPS